MHPSPRPKGTVGAPEELLARRRLGSRPDAGSAPPAQQVWPLEMQLAGLKTLEANSVYMQYMAATVSQLAAARIRNTYLLQVQRAGKACQHRLCRGR